VCGFFVSKLQKPCIEFCVTCPAEAKSRPKHLLVKHIKIEKPVIKPVFPYDLGGGRQQAVMLYIIQTRAD
jgi:hypothetical protein